MAEGEGAAKSMIAGLGHGAERGALEILDVIFDWVVPVITLVVGYVMSASIGLSGALGTVIDGALGGTGISQTVLVYIADLVAVLIWGVIGGAMWSVAKSYDGHYASYVLRPLATLFWGFALGELGAALSGKVLNGRIGSAITTLGA